MNKKKQRLDKEGEEERVNRWQEKGKVMTLKGWRNNNERVKDDKGRLSDDIERVKRLQGKSK